MASRRGEAGFTLIEVLIALFVLAVGILGATRLIASSEASTLDAELQQIATEEAEQAVEDVRALDYADIGHGTAGVPAAGTTYQAPGAPAAEDYVTLGSGTGVVPSRTFSIARGGDKPPVTGTIRTYVTWRDEECSLLDVGSLERISTLISRFTTLQGQLSPLTGDTGLINKNASKLTTAVINAIPSSDRPAYQQLQTELNAIYPVLNTTSTQVTRIQSLLAGLQNLEIDLCDLEPADLAGLKQLLEVSPTVVASLNSALPAVNTTLTDLYPSLSELFDYVTSLGNLVCGLLPTPNICGTVSKKVGPAKNALLPSTGSSPRSIATSLNDTLTAIDPDLSTLTTDTTHNTKRITVAVTVDTARDDITPSNTIWLSSVVTDPSAGLIVNGGS